MINVIDEYFAKKRKYFEKKNLQNENEVIQKENDFLQNELIDQKFVLRTMRQKLKILKTAYDRVRNVRELITSLLVSLSNLIAKLIVDINATNRLEKTKRSIVIFNSTIFNDNKTKFEHLISTMQNKLKTNANLLNRANDNDIRKY